MRYSLILYSHCVFLCGILPVIKCNLFFAIGSFCLYILYTKNLNVVLKVVKILWSANGFLYYEHKKHIPHCQQHEQPHQNMKKRHTWR